MSKFRPLFTGIVEEIAQEQYPVNLENPPRCAQPIKMAGDRYNATRTEGRD